MTTEQRQGALAAKAWADTHPAHPGQKVITTPGIKAKLAAACLLAGMVFLAASLVEHAWITAWLAGVTILLAARQLRKARRQP
jgi:Flp pilus assembly protein TadB